MSHFVYAIEHRWPECVIAPGAAPNRECCGNREPDSDELQMQDEGSFSWSACESCGSTFGGDRFPAHAIRRDSFGRPEQPGDIKHIEICVDCLMFHANGEEPENWKQDP